MSYKDYGVKPDITPGEVRFVNCDRWFKTVDKKMIEPYSNELLAKFRPSLILQVYKDTCRVVPIKTDRGVESRLEGRHYIPFVLNDDEPSLLCLDEIIQVPKDSIRKRVEMEVYPEVFDHIIDEVIKTFQELKHGREALV